MRIYSNKKRPVKASNDGRKWVNTELTQDEYAKFRNFLKKKGYKYETSGAGDMVHIEAYLNEAEIKEADNFLDTLDDVNGACGKKSVKADSFLRSTRKSDDGTFSYTVDTDKLYLGVPGAYFIWKGEWGDPWVEYDGGVYNASDLDSGVYSDFEEYCEENGLTFSDWRDEDNAFDEWAKEYGRDSAEGWLYDMSPFAKVIETSGDYRWAKEIGVNASTHTGIGASEDKHDSKFRIDIYQRNNPDALITREYKRFKTEDEAKNYGRSISKGNEVVVNEVKESTRRRPVKASSNRKRTPIMAGAGAGYTIEWELDTIRKINSFDVTDVSKPDKYGTVTVTADCDVDIDVTIKSAWSYMYGFSHPIEGVSAKIYRIIFDYNIPDNYDEILNPDDYEDGVDDPAFIDEVMNAMYQLNEMEAMNILENDAWETIKGDNFSYGGGWIHSKWDGTLLDIDEYNYALIQVTNSIVIDYVDAAVINENFTVEYTLDSYLFQDMYFDTEDEAREAAIDAFRSGELEEDVDNEKTEWHEILLDTEGSTDMDDPYTETVDTLYYDDYVTEVE